MKGSEDWLLGWNDHHDFIAPYRRQEIVGWGMVGFALGALLMSLFL